MIKKAFCAVLSAVMVFIFLLGNAFAEPSYVAANRYNIMLVIDASGSLNKTDPDKLRYEAIGYFVNLLAEKGNYLGAIVYSDENHCEIEPRMISSSDDKKDILDSLGSDKKPSGWTNTGTAMLKATELLKEYGNNQLESVIIFFSDGNTVMRTDEETAASKSALNEAVTDAFNQGIRIFSVCLNANNEADTSEMSKISAGTGGESRVVERASDLQSVFDMFYNLIFGTTTEELYNNLFPESGIVDVNFTIPGIGVEEVNIIIYGTTNSSELFYGDDDTPVEVEVIREKTYTMLKLRDIRAGKWRLRLTGNKGDNIKINLVYNPNLELSAGMEPNSGSAFVGDRVTVYCDLKENGIPAASGDQLVGFTAMLSILDRYGTELSKEVMPIVGNRFEYEFPCEKDGVYKFNISVSGYGLDKNTDTPIGPLRVWPKEDEPVPNTAPSPVEDSVTYTVKVLPFGKPELKIDMSKLAADKEDSELKYEILRSSFTLGEDYAVDGNVIEMLSFDLDKGVFEIQATDSGGLSCSVKVTVINIKVAWIALIGVVGLVLVVLAVLGILAYIKFTKPFYGTVSAYSIVESKRKGNPKTPRRGKIKLSVFRMDPVGLDYNKSYILASGDDYVTLCTDKPVTYGSQVDTKEVKIQSGTEAVITVNKENTKRLAVKFVSKIPKNRTTIPKGVPRTDNRKGVSSSQRERARQRPIMTHKAGPTPVQKPGPRPVPKGVNPKGKKN